VICGGYGGVMEAACRGASEEGGESLGVVLAGRGEPNLWVTTTLPARNFGDRLARLRDLCDGWIFLPRGLGTMLEIVWLAESIVKREAVARPFVFLGDFWKPTLEAVLREATGPGAEDLAACVRRANDPEETVELVCRDAGAGR
jgi:predicted Rossmann-fold nucleotide-binding protein